MWGGDDLIKKKVANLKECTDAVAKLTANDFSMPAMTGAVADCW